MGIGSTCSSLSAVGTAYFLQASSKDLFFLYCICVCSHCFLVFRTKLSWRRTRHFSIATRTIILHAQVHYALTRCLKRKLLLITLPSPSIAGFPKLSNEWRLPQRSLGKVLYRYLSFLQLNNLSSYTTWGSCVNVFNWEIHVVTCGLELELSPP